MSPDEIKAIEERLTEIFKEESSISKEDFVKKLLAALKEKDELLESQSTLLKWRDGRIQKLEGALKDVLHRSVRLMNDNRDFKTIGFWAQQALSADEESKK